MIITSRVRLAQWYHAHLRGERSGFDSWSQQPEMTLGNIACKRQKSASNDRSTLTLKLMGRVIRSVHWRGRQPLTQALFGENICKNERIWSCWGGERSPETFVCRSATGPVAPQNGPRPNKNFKKLAKKTNGK